MIDLCDSRPSSRGADSPHPDAASDSKKGGGVGGKQLNIKAMLEQRHSGRLKEKYGMASWSELESLPVENIEWDKLTPDDRMAMRHYFEKKEMEYFEAISELQHSNAIHPLGRDRTFRRYWVFRSVPGVFIEDAEDTVPDDFYDDLCQQIAVDDDEGDATAAKHLSSDMCSNGGVKCETTLPNGDVKVNASDSDNAIASCDIKPDLKVNSASSSSVANGNDVTTNDGESTPSVQGSRADTPSAQAKTRGHVKHEDNTTPLRFQSVHDQIKSRNQVRWSYYSSIAELDSLIARLNPRGFREGPLRQALQEQRKYLAINMPHCPTDMLSISAQESAATRVRFQKIKSRKRQRHGAVTNASAAELMELNLREQLLDLEERIFIGGLGKLRVRDVS